MSELNSWDSRYALLANQIQNALTGQLAVELADILFILHLVDGEEQGVGGVDGQRIDQRIAGKCHHGRVEGAVAQAGAGTEKTDGQDQQGEGGPPVPAREADAAQQAAAQPPAARQHGTAEQQCQQQFALAVGPQHGEHLFGIDEVFDVEAVGPHPVLGHEGGGGDLQEEQQPEPQGQPDPDELQPGT